MKLLVNLLFILTTALIFGQEEKIEDDFELELEVEYRYFPDEVAFQGQKTHFPSVAVSPEYSLSWNKGYDVLNFKGFFRLDVDEERTHWDIREFYYQKSKKNWEISLGFKKVYWGVTESNHLVDIINQTDAVESFDGEKKLGQPMVQFSLSTKKIGIFDFFYLPYHRKRTFPGTKGRLRFPIVIDQDDLNYESSAEELHQDFAVRWKHFVGSVDIGLSHFYGTGREPLFIQNSNFNIEAFYPIINQTGLDVQVTNNAFLWKLESIYRTSNVQDFFALVGGVEYTFSNIKSKGFDVGALLEYLYDDRGKLALTGLQNDVFFGSRIAFNDVQSTEILIGGIADLEKSSKIFSLEASRRLGESWKLEIEGRLFSNIDNKEFILSNFHEDSFLRVSILKYF
ncbi:hypothetical protein [Hyunsoonleella pacifica]|uniref:Porin n=1 Tax=Hyunsoonleella pacifica TaxID=1080224 RepID=A0A4Q9FWC3_9FLAO|nr:hypothetical protein [Hyunsoonleella pacifica]TBN18712.1 hypothetical protein EYD46_01200 [Hyunsoonleella pacifica]GGD04075.1 hypothetical protein GCM10011368_02390 [Hyunsoonleella pacifica]